jgi:hypothetical protein
MRQKQAGDAGRAEPGYVHFHAAGDEARGDFRCAECGYGVCVSRTLPTCPMCGSASWERGWMRMPLPQEPEPVWLPAD